MRKGIFGRQFKRDIDERKSLFKGLISSLILREKIKTTEAKAKSIKSEVEKIITKAKKGEIAKNFLQRSIYKEALDKLIKDIAPRFEKRQGGYTRIIRFGERTTDRAKMVIMELTEKAKALVLNKDKEAGKVVKDDKKIQIKKDKEVREIKARAKNKK